MEIFVFEEDLSVELLVHNIRNSSISGFSDTINTKTPGQLKWRLQFDRGKEQDGLKLQHFK